MEPPPFPEWPENVPPVEDAPPTPEQQQAAAGIIQDLLTIPGKTGECAIRLKFQEKDLLNWGEKVKQVEQARCNLKVEQELLAHEGVPWWGLALGVAGGSVVGAAIGIVLGIVAGGR